MGEVSQIDTGQMLVSPETGNRMSQFTAGMRQFFLGEEFLTTVPENVDDAQTRTFVADRVNKAFNIPFIQGVLNPAQQRTLADQFTQRVLREKRGVLARQRFAEMSPLQRALTMTPGDPIAGVGLGMQRAAEMSGLEEPQEIAQFISDAVEEPTKLALSLAIPGGMMAGATRLAALTRLPVSVATGMLGAIGEATNQQVGLTDPSVTNVLFQLASPPIIRGTGKVVSAGMTHLPGAAAGLTERAVAASRNLVAGLRPQNISALRDAFIQATRMPRGKKLIVPFKRLESAIKGGLASQERLSSGARNTNLVTRLASLQSDILDARAGGLEGFDFGKFRAELRAIGVRIGELRKSQDIGEKGSTTLFEGLRKLYGASLRDLDSMASGIGKNAAQTFQDYRKALRKDFAVLRLDQVLEDAIQARPGDGLTTINAAKFNRFLKQGKDVKFIKEGFEPEEWQDILDTGKELLKLPQLPRQQGLPERISWILARGSLAGGAVGVTGIEDVNLKNSALVGLAVVAPHMLAKMLMTRPGRSLIKASIDAGAMTHTQLGALSLLTQAATRDIQEQLFPTPLVLKETKEAGRRALRKLAPRLVPDETRPSETNPTDIAPPAQAQ